MKETLPRRATDTPPSSSREWITCAIRICRKHLHIAWKVTSLSSKHLNGFLFVFIIIVSACELGNLGGCVNVSRMYAKGDGVEKNPVAAKAELNELPWYILSFPILSLKFHFLPYFLQKCSARHTGVRWHRRGDDGPAEGATADCLPGGGGAVTSGITW